MSHADGRVGSASARSIHRKNHQVAIRTIIHRVMCRRPADEKCYADPSVVVARRTAVRPPCASEREHGGSRCFVDPVVESGSNPDVVPARTWRMWSQLVRTRRAPASRPQSSARFARPLSERVCRSGSVKTNRWRSRWCAPDRGSVRTTSHSSSWLAALTSTAHHGSLRCHSTAVMARRVDGLQDRHAISGRRRAVLVDIGTVASHTRESPPPALGVRPVWLPTLESTRVVWH